MAHRQWRVKLVFERRIPALTFVSSRQKVTRNPPLPIAEPFNPHVAMLQEVNCSVGCEKTNTKLNSINETIINVTTEQINRNEQPLCLTIAFHLDLASPNKVNSGR